MAANVGELNVKISVDISEALTALKAIQREAKKAAQALRELEAENQPLNFHVGTVIQCGGPRSLFRCICADSESAVFAPTSRLDGEGWHTEYAEMFVYPNAPSLRHCIPDDVIVVAEVGE